MTRLIKFAALPRALTLAALLAAAGLLSGCWDDTDKVEPSTSDTASGGTVGAFTVTAPAGSAIAGAKVEVPADAVTSADNITISSEDALPLAVNSDVSTAGFEQISKTIVIQRTNSADFGKPVDVTVPFDTTKLPASVTPIVAYLDEDTGAYSPIALKSINRAAGTLVFTTAHASKYAVIWIKVGGNGTNLDPSQLTTSVNFDPAVDSFFVHNFGSYEVPGGNSFGMAAYASWYHFAKKQAKGAGLRTLYKEGNPVLEEDDQVARELILRAYQAGDQKAHILALDNAAAQGATNVVAENGVALSLIQQLMLTKQAQLLVMGKQGTGGKWSDGQAVAVFGYDGASKRFQYYDTRFPGEIVTLPWDPVNGFGVDSKNKDYDVFAFAAFNSAYSSKTLNSLYTAAEAGFPASLYPKITISAPTETSANSGTYQIPTDDVVTLTGSVPRPSSASATAQRYAHVYLNGVRMANAFLVDNSSGAFSIPLGKLPTVAGTDVMVLISETEKAYAGWGSGAAWAGGFHAFKQFRIRVANQFFFQNMGFETGDLTGWASERHLWGQAPGQTIPSDKSAMIATPGFDLIATDLQVPLFGTKAFRINSDDGSEHISSVTQAAVVPSGQNPVLRFYWSAVLEDPQHSPEDQPYIDIVVVNKTKNIELYKKRFFSNDPTYSGWLSYQSGSWKSIPWQLVELSVAQYAGDTIELRVEVADCALGGHGGYGYLDVDE
ncbi:MAG: hypothetical protein WAQ05_21290 [Rubrivivax sp.]